MQTKNLSITAMDDAGKGLAIIADMTAVDHDGDGYQPGAFSWKGDQWCPLLTAHDRWAMPFGMARVYEEGGKAYAELHLNLETQAGREWHAALKFDLANGNPVQEWSYGFEVMEAEDKLNHRDWKRTLIKVDVHEVSTVVRGAGAGTRTIAMKGLKAALKEGEFDGLIDGLGAMAETLQGDPGLLSATGRKQLEDIHGALGAALVKADPEAEAKAQAEIERIFANHLTRDARRRVGA
jgi:hypothetical protein